MSKSCQLSFTILIVFTIVVLGLYCLNLLHISFFPKKHPKGKFICAPSTPGGPFQCQCRHPCR
ncbi:putative defensin-like protein 148 [Arabidopsis lyrata subsp. lyrata]|uniref:putative defensin-like protein 148 n=1 Tax=Arabidopsis lyrata subsp. lyrata TaxID=81972 RepID=UPI000A29D088|nr:putative defensin-like protein 148 [Arabidopsis lyrata subsp. lyrata]|eukprot:XP_020886870.1 putative defensin-like protein 148 [Arabidopsis lyrata subsp. lyrata]